MRLFVMGFVMVMVRERGCYQFTRAGSDMSTHARLALISTAQQGFFIVRYSMILLLMLSSSSLVTNYAAGFFVTYVSFQMIFHVACCLNFTGNTSSLLSTQLKWLNGDNK